MWVLFVFSLQPQTENPTWRKFEMMINLTSLTKLPQWWRFLSECLWAVRVPVTESRLIYSVKCRKKKILKSFSIIQIRWAGKDHRRLSCLRCVSLSVHGRNGDGKSGEEFCFIFWGMSSKLLAHSFRSPPPPPLHHLHLCPHQCQCVMRKCSLWKVSHLHGRDRVWGEGGLWGVLGAWRSVI